MEEFEYKNRGDGKTEVWSTGETSGKGYTRGREYPSRLLEVITTSAAEERQQAAIAETLGQREREIAADNAGESHEGYVESLPREIAGFCREGGDVVDDVGNYVMTIPRKASREGWDVKALAAYIIEQTEEQWEE